MLLVQHVLCTLITAMMIFSGCTPPVEEANDIRTDDDVTSSVADEIWEPVNAVVDGDTINRVNEEGELEGKWLRKYGDGSFMCTGNYSNGAKDGYWERKFPNGNWEYQLNFKDGEMHGTGKLYYENGQLRKEATYESGGEQGEVISYREDGTIEEKQWYINGIKGGKCELYNAEGELEARGAYAYNRRNGVWVFYKDGVETMQLEYDNGAIK